MHSLYHSQVVIISKTFTTAETMLNAKTVKARRFSLLQRFGEKKNALQWWLNNEVYMDDEE